MRVKCSTRLSLYAKRFGAGQWSFLGFGSEKKWYSISEDSPQGEWDRIAEEMMLTFAESKHTVLRSTSPLSRGVLKSKENCRYTIAPTRERLKLFFAQLFLLISSVFTEQSQTCVKNVNPAMIEQGDLLWKDNPTHCSCQVWWRQTYHWLMILHTKKIYCEDIESGLESHHNKTERANSVLMQDSWQQLKSDSISSRKTLNDFHNLQSQWPVVSGTLPRDESSSEPTGWFRGNTQIGPVLEVTTSYLQGKYGVEIRIESMNKDNSHSWVRISHGLNKLATDSSNKEHDDNELETSEMHFEDYALKLIECKWFCKSIKGQSKTTKTYFCQLNHKNCTYWGRNLDRYWTTRLFALWLFSVKETNQSSSSW